MRPPAMSPPASPNVSSLHVNARASTSIGRNAIPRSGRDIWRPAFDGLTTGPRVIFLGMGGKELGDTPAAAEENKAMLQSLAEFKDWLAARTIGREGETVIEPEARHNEAAWAARLPRALKALFPANP